MVERYTEKTDPWSSHTIIINWLNRVPADSSVLDIGTAQGLIGRRFFRSRLYLKGLEVKPEYAEMAQPFYNEYLCVDIANAPDDFISSQDVIILGDVLEHVPDPEQILTRLISLQKPGTQIIISVPNVANIWMRLQLLIGKFNYTENGILDKTHLRFFTKFTFFALLDEVGLHIEKLEFTPIPLTRVNPFFLNHWFGRFIHRILANITHLLPNLFAYQFVACTTIRHKEQSI